MNKSTSPLPLLVLPSLLIFCSGVTDPAGNAPPPHESGKSAPPDTAEPSQEVETSDLLTGSDWKFQDSGEDLDPSWSEPKFDDGDWKSGPAPLGYGDPDIATETSYGDDEKNKHITTYLRTKFKLPANKEATALQAKLRCDDGAIITLNGREVIRYNLPDEGVTSKTNAVEIISGDKEKEFLDFEIDPVSLQKGSNLLTVEMHQRGPTSSDLIFDMKLKAELKPAKTGQGSRPKGTLFKRSKIKKP